MIHVFYRLLLSIFIFVILATTACAQPGSIPMTPHSDIPLKGQRLGVPQKFRSFIDTNRVLYLPEGWSARVFHIGGLVNPRFMTWSPDSVLVAASRIDGRIHAFPDKSPKDGVADTMLVIAEGVFGHDVKFYDGAMYVAEERRVVKLTDIDGDGFFETQTTFIADIPEGGHITRTIVFDSLRQKIYLSIGSSCNVCREEGRAVILEYNIDGTGRREFATGIRNAVGMTLHPRTGRLWATNNGSDNLGDDVPAEWVDLVRDGGFYGWPFAHSYRVYNDFTQPGGYGALLPITVADSSRVRTMTRPAALLQAHSALMAIEFPNSDRLPEPYRRGAFVALHGSWNRAVPTGYKVVYLDFGGDADTIAQMGSDFLTGFLVDSSGQHWARPVGLESDADGNLYLCFDAGTHMVLIISPNSTGGLPPGDGARSLWISPGMPNPATALTTVQFSIPAAAGTTLEVFNIQGDLVHTIYNAVTLESGMQSATWDVSGLPTGRYYYRLSQGSQSQVSRFEIVR